MGWFSVILILLKIQLVNCDPLDKTENEQRLQFCGKTTKRNMFMARDISQSEAPWSVSFLYDPKFVSGDTCSGNTVSPRHILIATHCFATLDEEGWKVDGKFDEDNCKNNDYVITDESYLKRITIKSKKEIIAQAPEKVTLVNACIRRIPLNVAAEMGINSIEFMDDFAIIDLYEELKFSNEVNTVCVADDKSVNSVDMKLDFYGFGQNLPPVPDSGVNVLGHETIHINRLSLLDYFFFAHDRSRKTLACNGDSGGGAIGRIYNRKTLVGVLSATNCSVRNRTLSQERYTSVGFYSDKICEIAGICKSTREYDRYHLGYVKERKSVREEYGLPPNDSSSQEERESDSAREKCFILSLMVFVLNF